jgi:glycosyltransferase involved in cell wall biosynthesis
MENTLALVTVCFNSESTIRETLDSVRNQIMKPDEYIIIDGGSKDATLEIIKEYSDIVTKIVSEPDEGIYDAMNKGVKLAKADIIGLLNSDDTYIDAYVLHRVKSCFLREVSIFCGGVNYVDSAGKIRREWQLETENINIQQGWHPPHPAFFATKRLYDELGHYDLNYPIAADFDLMIRFILSNSSRTVLYRYPIVDMKLGGESNASFKNILKGNKEIRQSLRSNGLKGGYIYTLRRLLSKLKQKVK